MKKAFRILKFKKDKPIFEIKDLSKSFDGRPILKKLSMKVFPGECVGVLGPNGSGKTTLFSMCIGEQNVDDGKIFINGKSIIQIPIHLRSQLGLGYMPQTRNLFENLSCYNNLYGLIQLFEKNSKKAKEKIRHSEETTKILRVSEVDVWAPSVMEFHSFHKVSYIFPNNYAGV